MGPLLNEGHEAEVVMTPRILLVVRWRESDGGVVGLDDGCRCSGDGRVLGGQRAKVVVLEDLDEELTRGQGPRGARMGNERTNLEQPIGL